MQTILVIDDDDSLRDTIGVLFERDGFRAILAADGKTGLDQSVLLKPDLILECQCLVEFGFALFEVVQLLVV